MALCVTVGVVFFPASVIVPFAVSGGVGSYLYAQDMLGGIKPDSKDKLFTLRNIGVALAAIPLGAAIAGLSFLTLPVTLPASIFMDFSKSPENLGLRSYSSNTTNVENNSSAERVMQKREMKAPVVSEPENQRTFENSEKRISAGSAHNEALGQHQQSSLKRKPGEN